MNSADELSREELVSLLETAGELASQIDQDRLVDTILQKACTMTNSPDASVLLYDTERGGLYFAAAQGTKGPELIEKWGERSSQRVPLEGSKAGQAFSTGEIIQESDLDKDSQHFKGVDEQTGKVSKSVVSVPLRIAGKSIGVLQILNKLDAGGQMLAYTRHDCVLLEHLGRQAATAINNALLLGKLSAHMGLYSRQGARDLVERLDQPARRETLTMLFADMRGFTQLCQSQGDPTRTQEIMNDLMTMLADQVLTRGGIVNKFVGDAVFALFRDKDGPKQAVKCASGMLDRFDSLRRRWIDSCSEDLSFLDLGIGIATGPVAFGSFGSATVRDFTAMGTAVNLASALEAAARNGRRLLVDQPTWNAVHDIVSDFDGPSSFELGKPGQAVSIKYRQYHIKRLKPDVPVRVFVSHNHRDREFVERNITAQLVAYGIETWYSNVDIIPGEKYVQAIEAGLMKCDWVLVVVTEHSAQSDWVRAEVRTAFGDARFRNRILPVRADDVELSRISDQLGQLHAVDARQNGNLGESLYRLFMKREGEMQPNSAGA